MSGLLQSFCYAFWLARDPVSPTVFRKTRLTTTDYAGLCREGVRESLLCGSLWSSPVVGREKCRIAGGPDRQGRRS